jgi:predicted aldo/keto reductase-like oxidoreductase
MPISRRNFLEATALSALAVQAAEKDPKTGMPLRVLGKTGQKVSLLAFGCGSRWLAYKKEDAALEAMKRAVDQGVTYLDSAFGYGDGLSEERVGKFLKARGGKQGLFVVTKVAARDGDEAMDTIEGSLRRMQTSQLDLIHVHSLASEEDLAAVEKKGGVLDRLRKLRDEKVTRFIGVTSHTNPAVLKTALERHDFDCVQMALNVARMGNSAPSDKPGQGQTGMLGFESIALPVALKKKMGVTAMKIFGQEKLVGKAPIQTLLRYSMSLPVAAVVCGMPQLEHIDENIRVAKSFAPMSREEMESMSEAAAGKFKMALDRHFSDHVDC